MTKEKVQNLLFDFLNRFEAESSSYTVDSLEREGDHVIHLLEYAKDEISSIVETEIARRDKI